MQMESNTISNKMVSAVSSQIKVNLVKLLHCNDCPQVFENKKELKIHVQTHFDDVMLLKFNDDPKLNSKCFVALPKKEVYECDVCTRGFLTIRDKQFHTAKHEKMKQMKAQEDPRFIKIHKCDHCDYMFVQESTLKLHIKLVHDPLVYTCHCSMKYRLKEDYLQHKYLIHSERESLIEPASNTVKIKVAKRKVQCRRMSEESFVSDEDDYLPVKKIRKEKPLVEFHGKLPPGKKKQCKKCKKMYTQSFYHLHKCPIKNNNEGVETEKNSKSKSKTNDENTNSNIESKTSKRVMKSTPYREKVAYPSNRLKNPKVNCKICHKEIRKSRMAKHIDEVHKGLKLFECDICHKNFSQRGAVKLHREAMHNPNADTYPCTFCDRIFKRKEGVLQHMKIHMNIKDKLCAFCGKGFADPSARNRHELIHTGEKPHKCQECGKCFRESGTLSIHKLIHKGVKNFECNLCKMRFYLNTILKTHIKTVHNNQSTRYKCDLCKHRTKYKNNLIFHFKNLHPHVYKTKKSKKNKRKIKDISHYK